MSLSQRERYCRCPSPAGRRESDRNTCAPDCCTFVRPSCGLQVGATAAPSNPLAGLLHRKPVRYASDCRRSPCPLRHGACIQASKRRADATSWLAPTAPPATLAALCPGVCRLAETDFTNPPAFVLPAVCAASVARGFVGYLGKMMSRCAAGTMPGRGKCRCACIQHNRALPKTGQSLRKASLGGLSLRALRVRVMVVYVLRPGPSHCAIQRALRVYPFRRCAQWWCGPPARPYCRAAPAPSAP
jgi:hypothetical protein